MRYRPVTLRSHGSPSARSLPASRIPECTTPARAITSTERQCAQAGTLCLWPGRYATAGSAGELEHELRGLRRRGHRPSHPARLLALGAGDTRRPAAGGRRRGRAWAGQPFTTPTGTSLATLRHSPAAAAAAT